MTYKEKEDDLMVILFLSGYCDSNTGPSGPKPDALANCATPRIPSIGTANIRQFWKKNKIFAKFVIWKLKKVMIIEAHDIHKSFGTLEVLKGIDFSAAQGETVSIVGASGAGKSTLLQILGTLSSPDCGSLVIDGQDVLKLGSDALAAFRGRRIGFVFQAHHLLPEFTALENVMIPALIAGKGARETRARALGILESLGLGERAAHKPSEMSGGEQQRTAIARAIINEPAVLFADEPTGNLDSATKQEIHRVFFDLRDRLGQTIVIVTHDPELASLCDRCLTMKDGLIVK